MCYFCKILHIHQKTDAIERTAKGITVYLVSFSGCCLGRAAGYSVMGSRDDFKESAADLCPLIALACIGPDVFGDPCGWV